MSSFDFSAFLLNPFKIIVCLLTALGLLFCGTFACLGVGVMGVASVFQHSSGSRPNMTGFNIGGDNSVTLAAKDIAAHLQDCRGMKTQAATENGCNSGSVYPIYAAYDAGFPKDLLQGDENNYYWRNGYFQCVSFVMAAYKRIHPLEASSNAKYLLGMFEGNPNYQVISDVQVTDPDSAPPVHKLPITPGDIFVMSGGEAGHTGIVLGWKPPQDGKPGQMTIANANAQKPIDTLTINPDNSIAQVGYWSTLRMIGYIHPKFLPVVPSYPADSTMSQFVDVARQAAQDNGIRSDIYIKLIKAESNFDPNALSSAGAVGIAQLMPATAEELGVDPYDPIASLKGGAKYLAGLLKHFAGDYQKAVAAYNVGPGSVDNAVNHYHDTWLSALPTETQNYVYKIFDEKK